MPLLPRACREEQYYPLLHKDGFLLFACKSPKHRLSAPACVRMVTFYNVALNPKQVLKNWETLNDDLSPDRIAAMISEKQVRSQLYSVTLNSHRRRRRDDLLRMNEVPALWLHPLVLDLFNVTETLGYATYLNSQKFYMCLNSLYWEDGTQDLMSDFMRMVHRMDTQEKTKDTFGRDDKVAELVANTLNVIRLSLKSKRPDRAASGGGGAAPSAKNLDSRDASDHIDACRALRATRAGTQQGRRPSKEESPLKEGDKGGMPPLKDGDKGGSANYYVVTIIHRYEHRSISEDVDYLTAFWRKFSLLVNGFVFLVIERETPGPNGTFRLTVVNQGPGRKYHAQWPSGQRIEYDTTLQLGGIEESRMLNPTWWALLVYLTKNEVIATSVPPGEDVAESHLVRNLYMSFLPWLVQRPLQDFHVHVAACTRAAAAGTKALAVGDDDSVLSPGGRSEWLVLLKQDAGFCGSILSLLRFLLLTDGVSVEAVSLWFLRFRAYLAMECSNEIGVFDKARTLSATHTDVISEIASAMAVEIADVSADEKIPPAGLFKVLQSISNLQDKLGAHVKARRDPLPERLLLSSATPLLQQHLFFGFDRLSPQVLHGSKRDRLMGDSLYDRDMSGLKSIDQSSLTTMDVTSFDEGVQLLARTLELCLQLSNLEDVKWRGQLICCTLADVLLVRLPLPSPGSNDCIWTASDSLSGDG